MEHVLYSRNTNGLCCMYRSGAMANFFTQMNNCANSHDNSRIVSLQVGVQNFKDVELVLETTTVFAYQNWVYMRLQYISASDHFVENGPDRFYM